MLFIAQVTFNLRFNICAAKYLLRNCLACGNESKQFCTPFLTFFECFYYIYSTQSTCAVYSVKSYEYRAVFDKTYTKGSNAVNMKCHCSQTERAHASNKAMFTVRLYIFVFHKHPTVFLKKNIQNCWSYNTYIICAMAVLALFITMHFIALCKRGRLVVPTRVVE